LFTVHRGLSNHKETERTKTGEVHYVPAVSGFLPYIEIEQKKGILGIYFFSYAASKAHR